MRSICHFLALDKSTPFLARLGKNNLLKRAMILKNNIFIVVANVSKKIPQIL